MKDFKRTGALLLELFNVMASYKVFWAPIPDILLQTRKFLGSGRTTKGEVTTNWRIADTGNSEYKLMLQGRKAVLLKLKDALQATQPIPTSN